MSSQNNRVKQLEKDAGIGTRFKYMCNIYTGWAKDFWGNAEELRTQGYKIQPFIPSAGGTGGAVFYLPTWAELKAFSARPDVDLQLFVVGDRALDPETGAEIDKR